MKETEVKGSNTWLSDDAVDRLLIKPWTEPEYDKCKFCNKVKNKFVFFCPEAKKDGATFSMMCLDCFKLELNK